jgi:GNAT superfamily N-acetyltransferase
MLRLLRTDAGHADFIRLTGLLDQYLEGMNGDDHAFLSQFNTLQAIRRVVVAFEDQAPVACGAFKKYEGEEFPLQTAEIKRMFVLPAYRRLGIARRLLEELESWAASLSYSTLVLETGQAHLDAIRLYEQYGFQRIPNYGQYAGFDRSVCMSKTVSS